MKNKYFPEAEYKTPANHKRVLGDKLTFGTSIYFNYRFLKYVLRNRNFAFKNLYDTAQWAECSYEIMKLTEDCGARYHIEGFDNVESVADEPVVFISNHMGTLETMVFPSLIAPVKEVTFVVKDTLTTNPIFGPVMRARNPIAVTRKDTRKDLLTVMNEGQKKLSEGTSVIIFPQSTRTEKFIPEEFNSLGVKLAAKAGVKVMPMAIKTDFWGNGKLVKDLGTLHRKEPVHIKFGAPMEVKGSGKEEHNAIVQFIAEHLAMWNAQK